MVKLNLRGKILIAAICAVSIALSAKAIITTYKLEKELKEIKAETEEASEDPVPLVQIHSLEYVPKTQIIAKEEEIAPVQVIKEEIFKPHEEIPLAEEYQEWIEAECERLGVSKAFAYALIESESSFRTGILINDGGGKSAGLCQINSVNWPDMEKQGLDPFDEYDNITYCLSLVSKYLNKYDGAEDLFNTVITCYKAGEGGAKRLNYHLSSCEHIKERMEHFNKILNKED